MLLRPSISNFILDRKKTEFAIFLTHILRSFKVGKNNAPINENIEQIKKTIIMYIP
jgi:hypothetical protein